MRQKLIIKKEIIKVRNTVVTEIKNALMSSLVEWPRKESVSLNMSIETSQNEIKRGESVKKQNTEELRDNLKRCSIHVVEIAKEVSKNETEHTFKITVENFSELTINNKSEIQRT